MRQQENLIIAAQPKISAVLVSYEKASSNPSDFIDEITSLLSLRLTVERKSMIAWMERGRYKDWDDVFAPVPPSI